MSELESKVEELSEKIERLEEEKEELKREYSQIKARNDRLEKFIEAQHRDSVQEHREKREISRRGFLKKIGVGALGIGALSLVPAASKVTISDTGVTKDGSSLWYSGLSSNFDISGQNITDSGTTIWNSNDSHIPASSIDTSNLDVDSVDGYDIQKNGSDASGVINFKT